MPPCREGGWVCAGMKFFNEHLEKLGCSISTICWGKKQAKKNTSRKWRLFVSSTIYCFLDLRYEFIWFKAAVQAHFFNPPKAPSIVHFSSLRAAFLYVAASQMHPFWPGTKGTSLSLHMLHTPKFNMACEKIFALLIFQAFLVSYSGAMLVWGVVKTHPSIVPCVHFVVQLGMLPLPVTVASKGIIRL